MAPSTLIATKEHGRFVEFAKAVCIADDLRDIGAKKGPPKDQDKKVGLIIIDEKNGSAPRFWTS